MPVADEPRILHSLPGRVRIHAPAISVLGAAALEEALGCVDGVRRAHASALTRNVLVEFDQERLDERGVLARLRSLSRRRKPRSRSPQTTQRATAITSVEADSPDSALQTSVRRRARVAVRGLDRDPSLSSRLVKRLSRRPEVLRVSPSPLTGRVLIELTGSTERLQEILDEIADVELPATDDEEIPAHPLDASAIIEAAATSIGAGLGLLLLFGRRIAGSQGAPIPQGAGEVASTVGLIEGIPAASHRIEDALGHERKALAFGATAIIAMSASGNPLGLAFAGAAALRLLTESLARRQAWQEYEQRTREHPDAHPGAVTNVAPGQRVPWPG